MPIEFEAPQADEMGGATAYLDIPGIYHLTLLKVMEDQLPNGDSHDCVSLVFTVLDGTEKRDGKCSEEGKQTTIVLWYPNYSGRDEGKFARVKLTAAAVALGVITPADCGKNVSLEFNDAIGRQCVAKLSKDDSRSDNERTFLQLAYSDIWHVDDPRARSCPKSKPALDLLPKEQRHPHDYFADLTKSTGGNAAPSKPAADEKAAESWDDLA